MKRSFLIACLLLLVISIGAAGQRDVQKEDEVVITYMFWTPIYEPYVREAVRIFESENPGIRVQYESLAFDPYWQKVQNLYAAGNPPDTFDMSIAFVWDYADMDAVMPMDEFISGNIDNYYERAIDMVRYPDINGQAYAMPYQWVTSLLFFNKDMFDEAGIDYPDNSWTYEKLIEVSAKLTDAEKGQFGFFSNASHTFLDSMIKAYGGKVLSEDFSSSHINEPAAVKVIQKLVDMIHVDKSAPVAASYDALLASGGEMFRSGRIGMTIDGSYMIDSFRNVDFNWDAVMVPSGPVKRSIYGGPDSISISSSTKHPEEAWKFVEFMTGVNRPQETWIPGGVPINRSVAESDDWFSLHAQWISDPYDLLRSGDYLEGADFSSRWLEWRINTMNSELAPAFMGRKKVQDAANDAKTAIERVISD